MGFRAAEMEYWRIRYGIARPDKIRSEEITMWKEVTSDIINYIEKKRLTRYGHVRRKSAKNWLELWRIGDRWVEEGKDDQENYGDMSWVRRCK